MTRLLRRRVFYKTCTVGDCIRNAPLLYIYGKSGTKVPLFLIIKNSSKQTLSGIIWFPRVLCAKALSHRSKTQILPRASRFLAGSHGDPNPINNPKSLSHSGNPFYKINFYKNETLFRLHYLIGLESALCCKTGEVRATKTLLDFKTLLSSPSSWLRQFKEG